MSGEAAPGRAVIPLAVRNDRPPGVRLASLPPLALYVHFPWCVRKCPYCDFNSHESRGPIPEDDYIAALVADLESALPQVWGRRVTSVFFGGGTPSLMSPRGLDALLAALRARLPLVAEAEITLEANPGTVEAGHFAGYRAAGVNRLSLGIQSFDDAMLAAIGRIHDARAARAATEQALRHFDNVNLDLMYALPGQGLDEALADLRIAAASGATHVSAYHLTVEPNTAFHRRPPPLPDEDLAADMQEAVEATLAQHGFAHYETSAFARPGRQCRHNLNYWQFGDYLGIGAGAHGKISFPDRILRETRPRHPREYMDAASRGEAVESRREVALADLPFEFMMNALRLTAGVPASLFAERTGLDESALQPALAQARARGLLTVEAGRMAPTERGRRFLNDLLEMFLKGVRREG
ncbi:MAG: oxygen-independent coproporphyrinogen III oxidase-like protein [Betaproteobacteria bacterium]|nr:oxygen-independent coproporphyrinogen III oxidase-like protein [Betaproteobacteria bacterium]